MNISQVDLIQEDDRTSGKDESVSKWKESQDVELASDFRDNVSDFLVQHFVDKFQRRSSDECDLITLNDIKDVVLFTYCGNLNPSSIKLFYTPMVDQFLRSLILYFQYFARLWYIVTERGKMKRTHIAHPNSIIHETVWIQQLSDLRFILARDYATILLGLKGTSKFHHYLSGHQTPEGDRALFELLHKLSLRVVEVILNEKGNQAMHEEFDHLFKTGTIKAFRRHKGILDTVDIDLEKPFYCPKLQFKSPLIKELYRPNRNPILKNIGIKKLDSYPDEFFKGIELALLCVEEHYAEANFFIGILGKVRAQYNPLLTVQEEFLVENEDFSMYDVKRKTVFGETTVDRSQAYMILPKRDVKKPYRVRDCYYNVSCMDMKKERQRLKDLWLHNADEKYRLRFQENHGKSILMLKEVNQHRTTRVKTSFEQEEMLRDSFEKTAQKQEDMNRKLRLKDTLSDTSFFSIPGYESHQTTPNVQQNGEKHPSNK